MEQPPPPQESLDDIRREIDRIDDGILKLVAQRLDVVDRVRAHKAQTATLGTSPIRPGREAQILRRLIERAQGAVPADLLFRIWRALIAAATLKQAPLRIHGSAEFFASATSQTMLREYFGPTAFCDHPGEAIALETLSRNTGDLAAVAIDGPWARAWMEGRAGPAQVISVLPFLTTSPTPRLLVFGHARAEPTGADETLVLTDGQLPRDFAPQPLWQMKTGGLQLTSLPGFLAEHQAPLVGLARSNGSLALSVVGRYPSPVEIRT
ncbi:chorismate mutase [Taklimakanibacter lacteus]|uniref:chorismate mutase n=1 Tax=Taklimakanibacter lacteus TaxID=2268456 RepID=UPI000E66A56B